MSNGTNGPTKGLSKYQLQQKGKQGQSSVRLQGQSERVQYGRKESVDKEAKRLEGDAIDSIFGFTRLKDGPARLGWLLNYLPISIPDETGMEKSAMDLYFLDRDGGNFKATIFYEPYLYVDVLDERRTLEIIQQLQKRFEGCRVEQSDKEDLDMPGHLSGKKHKFLKLIFGTTSELNDCKQSLMPIIQANQKKREADEEYDKENTITRDANITKNLDGTTDPLSFIADMREHDISYSMRASIDNDLRVGSWYIITPQTSSEVCDIDWQKDMLELCQPRVLAFDIECEKLPLKFPNAENDRIYMISYMVAGKGYLLINREVVTADVDDFEYTPLPKYPGPFEVFNLKNEEDMLRYFVDHIQKLRPHIIVTYNGDFFDWPYVETRCSKFSGINLYKQLGIRDSSASSKASKAGSTSECEYTGRCIVHLDAFCWVKRDSYLPQGNQGLKAVTKYKLGYNPVEVDPEDMLREAQERPAHMASYSVSDAVATYYLYTTYVHNFIFSMSTIIPMGPEDVLRKGSGTLCEALLMVEAYKGEIICPNKQTDALESFYEGHLLESETYIGGHVECLEAGVFRADIPTKFSLIPTALQGLIDHIDRDLTFAIEIENGLQRHDIVNYDEIRAEIVCSLEMLRDCPNREELPAIYHLDVGAMYPNIILTNRLQPSGIVSQTDCASCEFNKVQNDCKRPMTWTWRGEFSPASMSDYQAVKRQLMYEKVDDKPFTELSEKVQSDLINSRLKIYANRVYKKTKTVKVEERDNTVCMRENPFYVNTVRAFRDRRYDYKLLTKTWKGKVSEADKAGDVIKKKVAEDKAVLMDSLQLAHKCILNSFYGYVMRKGARWRSMEMAGIVTHTGSNIIKQARELVEQLGRPLELDTDGIWCILPSSFPQEAKFITNKGKKIGVEYPCAMLNADVHARYTNHQYQDRVGTVAEKNFDTHNECSIYFELDGPYKAMILPASPEEGRLLKKKYAVYNFDGSLAELKGFEVKRRGELEMIKTFQTEVFERFLDGNTIQECYQSVGDVANRWLDVLDEQGVNMVDDELMEYISERKTISKTFDEYGGRKATSLTTASRLGDFLGLEMLKDKGLNCQLVISRLPHGAPVTERAIPVAIFSAEPAIKRFWLRKWLKEPGLDVDNFRDLIDWNYYKERLGNSIQKIITIPAGLQRVLNPCPRIIHPTWLTRQFNENLSGLKQSKISNMFKSMNLLNASSSTSSDNNNIFSKKKSLFESNFPLLKSQNKRDHSDISKNTTCNDDIGDMEDYGSKKSSSPPVPISHFSKSKGISPLNLNNKTDDLIIENVIIPAMSLEPVQNADELNKWIISRKNSWKSKRNEKKKELLNKNRNGSNHWDLNEETEANGKKKPVGVVDFVRNANLEAAHKVWQIVELQELDTPGDFIVWAMTSKNQIQKLKLTIPRYMYVNCNGTSAEESTLHLGGKKINHHLPHGRPNFNLYEVIIPEQKFVKNGKTLTEFLSNPQIEGVYETQAPLWFRGVIKLGCNARVINNRGNKNMDTISNYKLSDLETVNTSSHGYLSSNISVYRRIFLYYIHAKNGLGAVALFIFDTTNVIDEELFNTNQNGENEINFDYLHIQSGKAFVWIANKGNKNDSKLPFQRMYRKFQPNEKGNMKFTSVFTRDINESFRACNERLSIYHRERHGPTIVIAQGLLEQRQWRKKFPLLNEFPLATMPANSTDDDFPLVGWQMFVTNRIVQRSLLFSIWFDDRLKCARYAHIPVCNLGSNAPTTMIDIIFARQLQHNRHLLWASEGKMPDIGGAETDEHGAWSIPLSEPVINEPGVYRGICVELDIYGLSICAILSSSSLDSEGFISETTTGQSESASSSYSSDGSCTRAFNLLKAVVTKWMHDMEVSANPISDSLLLNLYRYLCGYGESLLKDPSLHRVVYGLMTKLFKKLISEFKKLGVQVIYADFERIIIHTNKYDLESAKEYIEFITNAVMNNDIFGSALTISTKLYFEQLIWMGADNYGGILCKDENEEEGSNNFENEEDMYNDVHQMESYNENNNINYDNFEEEEEEEEEGVAVTKSKVRFKINNRSNVINDSDEDEYGNNSEYDDIFGNIDDHNDGDNDGEPQHRLDNEELYGEQFSDENPYYNIEEIINSEDKYLKSHWNMASFLPENAAQYFTGFVGEFMKQYKKKRQTLVNNNDIHLKNIQERKLNTEDNEDNDIENNEKYIILDDDEINEEVTKQMILLIKNDLSFKCLAVIDEFNNLWPKNARHVTADKIFPRRAGSHLTLLSPQLEFVKAITHVFSLDSSLTSEVTSLKRMLLSQLGVREFNDNSVFHDPCLSFVLRDVICPYCSTCRDMDLLRDLDLTQEDTSKRWLCQHQHCNNKINTFEIEDRLIQEIERQSIGFLLQDMRCPQTHIVSTRYSSSTSVLCKPLAMDITQENLEQNFTILLKVAKFHEFSLLENAIRALSHH